MDTFVKKQGTLRIYTGRAEPFTARGANQINMLDFAYKYQSWHTYGRDKATMRALEGLERRGSIIVNRQTQQFRINTDRA